MSHRLPTIAVRFLALILLSGFAFSNASFAQGLLAKTSLPDAPSSAVVPVAPAVAPASPVMIRPSVTETPHKFWDTQNRILFAANAAFSAADFALTRSNLQNGGRELNPMVRMFGRSTPGLAANFVGETAGVIGISYMFHRTGHHKLERAVSFVNLGASMGAVSYGLAHR